MDMANRPLGVTARTAGTNQAAGAAYNSRLTLTLLREAGALPGAEVARRTGLTAQAASGILRRLEESGLVRRGDALRGQVGKPRVPFALDPDGACALGLKVGRRSVELVLVDLAGTVRTRYEVRWARPLPGPLSAFLDDAVPHVLTEAYAFGFAADRLAGTGVAMPWDVWAWHEAVGGEPGDAALWQGYDLAAAIEARTGRPVWLRNDITCAARAELAWGPRRAVQDWAYFHVGAFVGGGVVLDGRVRDGPRGNAGAFGSLSSNGPGGAAQLIDRASLHLLERATGRPLPADDWSGIGSAVDAWIAQAAPALAQAALDVCAVLDFEAVVVDGAVPPAVRDALVGGIAEALPALDARGLIVPTVEAGSIGAPARALGAATVALEWGHFLGG